METRKKDMCTANLNRLSGGADYIWHCLPPRGRSGGILLGIDALNLELSLIVEGEFFLLNSISAIKVTILSGF